MLAQDHSSHGFGLKPITEKITMNSETTPQKSASNSTGNSSPLAKIRDFVHKYKGEIGMVILVLYVFLLGLGTVGEIWDVEWILDLPLFRPPGKY